VLSADTRLNRAQCNSHAMMLGSVYCPSLLYLGALGIALYVASKHRLRQASFRQFVRLCHFYQNTNNNNYIYIFKYKYKYK
jgi:hypothetical protein